MLNCTDKFLKHSERVGARFAEHNAGALHRLCFFGSFPSHSLYVGFYCKVNHGTLDGILDYHTRFVILDHFIRTGYFFESYSRREAEHIG